MNQQKIIEETKEFVKKNLEGIESGHDWWHTMRVWTMAKRIAVVEGGDLLVIELSALLHDVADAKFHSGDEEKGPTIAKEFLSKYGMKNFVTAHVINIIKNISFKGGNTEHQFASKELSIVQDADRLDAIGAIGISRAFNYGGFKNRAIYDPTIAPQLNMTAEEYRKSNSHSINHFYEKLLLLKDRMNTNTGKKIAEKRHAFMEQYLAQFLNEWDSKDV